MNNIYKNIFIIGFLILIGFFIKTILILSKMEKILLDIKEELIKIRRKEMVKRIGEKEIKDKKKLCEIIVKKDEEIEVPEEDTEYYKIKKGEYLWGFVRKYYNIKEEIKIKRVVNLLEKINRISGNILEGQKIKIIKKEAINKYISYNRKRNNNNINKKIKKDKTIKN